MPKQGWSPSENSRNNYLSEHSPESGYMVNLGWIGEPSVLTHEYAHNFCPHLITMSHLVLVTSNQFDDFLLGWLYK
jgi:hypothetical protein